MRPLSLLMMSALAACGARELEGTPSTPVTVAATAEEPPAFAAQVTSLRARQSTTVRASADERSAPLGVLAQDMRVGWRGARPGPGCGRWIEIEPRGFVCERALEPTPLPPYAVELPRMEAGAILPGIYGAPVGRAARKVQLLASEGRFRAIGKVSVLLKFRDEVQVRGRTFLRTRLGALIDARDLRRREPSTFSGLEVGRAGTPLLPLAWAQSRVSAGSPVALWSAPEDGELLGVLEPRTALPILGQTDDGLWARVGEDAWVSFDDLHVARRVEPPPGLGADERWLDVDLQEQVLVAYEGQRPVFTTLVSTGTANPTPEGAFRIWTKFSEADMQGNVRGHRYAVSSVPWAMYFEKDFALHAAYWHDGFGEPRSSGCVNLSPQDARLVYQWSSPSVPTGWSMSYATPDTAGSLVQIRKGASSFNGVRPPPAPPRAPSKERLGQGAVARSR